MSGDQYALVMEARRTLGLWTQPAFARFLGVSTRTVQRHPGSAGVPMGAHHEKIVRALHPVNPQLAKQLAIASRLDLVVMGLEPATVTKPVLPSATREHATLVVCAAADALNMVPRDVRPVLANIFSNARALGVDMDSLAKLLSEGESAKGKREK
jgi:hypothetical protein